MSSVPAGAVAKRMAILLRLLPLVVHINQEPEETAMRLSLEQMSQELRTARQGTSLIVQHLADLLLVQALRSVCAEGRLDGVGWLFALANRHIGTAIVAMHQDPARRWTLQALAKHSGMSRSTFALKFKDAVGEPGMEYLKGVRK